MEPIVEKLNENKFFVGLMMIFVTIGGRYIITELNETQKKIVHNKLFRRLIIFGAFFMSTRDIFTAIILTIMFILIITELFNDEDNMDFLYEKEKEEENKIKKIDETIQTLTELKNQLSIKENVIIN